MLVKHHSFRHGTHLNNKTTYAPGFIIYCLILSFLIGLSLLVHLLLWVLWLQHSDILFLSSLIMSLKNAGSPLAEQCLEKMRNNSFSALFGRHFLYFVPSLSIYDVTLESDFARGNLPKGSNKVSTHLSCQVESVLESVSCLFIPFSLFCLL